MRKTWGIQMDLKMRMVKLIQFILYQNSARAWSKIKLESQLWLAQRSEVHGSGVDLEELPPDVFTNVDRLSPVSSE
jgi:hypothetical protein